MEIEENDKEVIELLSGTTKNPKKKKYTSLFIAKKMKRPKDTSDFGKWMQDILKKKMTDVAQIKSFIEGKYSKTPSPAAQKLLSLFGRTKVSNGRLLLSDNFANKPLYFYVNWDKFNFNVFSNDELFLSALYKDLYDKFSAAAPDSDILPFMSNGIIMKVYYVSKPFVYEGVVKKGYYQDFQSDFAAIGADVLDEAARKTLMSVTSRVFSFKYKGIDYACYQQPGPVVMICKANENRETEIAELAKGYEQLKVFNKSTGISLGIKEMKIGKKAIKFLDIRIKPEDFCPSFLIIYKAVNCNLIYKMKFDLNQLFDDLDNAYLKKKGFAFYKNSCYWDTMESWYDFLSIYSLTSSKVNANDKKILDGYIELYHQHKSLLVIWQRMQLFLQKIYKLFFSSFVNHIDKYKLKKVKKDLKYYLDDVDSLMAEQDDYLTVKNFIIATSMYGDMMARQFDKKVMEIPKLLYEAVKDLDNGKNVETLAIRFRQLGQTIFQISLSSSNDPVFPIVLAQGAFLGDLKGGLDVTNPLETLIQTYVGKELKIEKTNEEIQKTTIDLMTNMENYIQEVITTNVRNYVATSKIPISSENLAIVIASVVDNIKRLPGYLDELKAVITKQVMAGKSIKDLEIDTGLISKWVDIYATTYKKNLLIDKINSDKGELDALEAKEKHLLNSEPPSGTTTTVPVANPPARRSGLINISTNIDGGSSLKIPSGLSGGYDLFKNTDDIIKKMEDEKKEKSKFFGETPGGETPIGVTPGGETPIGVTPGGELPKLNINMNVMDDVQKKIDEMDIESESGNVKKKKLKESFIIETKPEMINPFKKDTSVSKKREEPKLKVTNPFKKGESKSKRYDKNSGTSKTKTVNPFEKKTTTSKPKNPNPFSEKKLSNVSSKDTLFPKKQSKIASKSKKKGQLDAELERINENEKELSKIKTLRQQEIEYDHDSFISQDYGTSSLNNRTSLLADIVAEKPTDKNLTVKKRKMIINKTDLDKLVSFYAYLINFMKNYAYIKEIPNTIANALRARRNVGERLKYLFTNFPVSDGFLDNLAKESTAFISSKELANYVSTGKWKRPIREYNLNLIEKPAVIREIMYDEFKHWPIYKPPLEAEEVHLSYSKQGLSESGSEPEDADDLDEDK